MKLTSLEILFKDCLQDIYSAENQLLKALPKMVKAASSDSLKDALESHLLESHNQVERLLKIEKKLGMKLAGKKCKAMEGLIEEGKEVLDAEGDETLIDAALIGAAQKVEHYEISAYGTACAIAKELGHEEIGALLHETLQEERAADEKLTTISEGEILPLCNEDYEHEKQERQKTSDNRAAR